MSGPSWSVLSVPSLSEYGLKWFKDVVSEVTEWFLSGIQKGYDEFTDSFLGTPTPETADGFIFGTPTNQPWTALHEALVGGRITAISLLILLVAVYGRHTIRIFNFGSGYEARKTKRTAWTGAFLIVTWYWIAALVLFFVEGFTVALLPSIEVLAVRMIELLGATLENPALAIMLSTVSGTAMWLLQALFIVREYLLYIYIFGMPIGFALMYSNVPVVSQIAGRFVRQFVPLVLVPIPVAILFRGYVVLFTGSIGDAVTPKGAFARLLVAGSLPILSVIIVWKLFTYAAPLLTSAVSKTAGAGVKAGVVLGAAYVAGPASAATAASYGTKAAVGSIVSNRLRGSGSESSPSAESPTEPEPRTNQDNITTDAVGQTGVPAYRRTENDPGYY